MTLENNKKIKEHFSKTCPLFFKTFTQTKSSSAKILEACEKYEAVYLIIKEEGDMDDPDLLTLHKAIKVYAGTAWTGIHKMRLEEGLYDPRFK